VTYVLLTLVVLTLVALVCVPVLRRLPRAPLVWTAAALVAMTAVFDSAIVGFGLTVYDPAAVLGVYVGAAPVEDFGYTLAALMIVPTLWTVLARRSRGRRADEADGG
jgi:lycopene cyclase domain-containing protein